MDDNHSQYSLILKMIIHISFHVIGANVKFFSWFTTNYTSQNLLKLDDSENKKEMWLFLKV